MLANGIDPGHILVTGLGRKPVAYRVARPYYQTDGPHVGRNVPGGVVQRQSAAGGSIHRGVGRRAVDHCSKRQTVASWAIRMNGSGSSFLLKVSEYVALRTGGSVRKLGVATGRNRATSPIPKRARSSSPPQAMNT
jgi:hypothetical protein